MRGRSSIGAHTGPAVLGTKVSQLSPKSFGGNSLGETTRGVMLFHLFGGRNFLDFFVLGMLLMAYGGLRL